jgi:hypothetical protein
MFCATSSQRSMLTFRDFPNSHERVTGRIGAWPALKALVSEPGGGGCHGWHPRPGGAAGLGRKAAAIRRRQRGAAVIARDRRRGELPLEILAGHTDSSRISRADRRRTCRRSFGMCGVSRGRKALPTIHRLLSWLSALFLSRGTHRHAIRRAGSAMCVLGRPRTRR